LSNRDRILKDYLDVSEKDGWVGDDFMMNNRAKNLIQSLLGAIAFYTILPLPITWEIDLQRIARWASWIGIGLGGCLGLLDFGLSALGIPTLTRSALLVASWVFLTGGLHLDGAIDTADGLAVSDPQRRLAVMKESVTGAFGVIVAALLLLLKTAAISDLSQFRWLSFMVAAGWGRWGQIMAIALYPYLRETGKGAFHKQSLQLPQDILWGLLALIALSWLPMRQEASNWGISLAFTLIGSAIALLTGFWFNRQLGGQTGDTYGAIVEWTEALILCCLTSL
jgi:adenosylcobinamide-GDP ribazoletransferase